MANPIKKAKLIAQNMATMSYFRDFGASDQKIILNKTMIRVLALS